MRNFDDLVEELAGDLQPVRPISPVRGRALVLATAIATCAIVLVTLGIRPDIAAGQPVPLVMIIAGLFTIVASAATWAATRAARPAVGAVQGSARWALATLLLLPAVAIVSIAVRPSLAAGLEPEAGLSCLASGLASSVLTGALLTWWVRRGAPANPARVGWLIGLTSGAIGALAITLECPHDALTHAGIWHVAVVLISAAFGRVVISRLISW